MPINNNPFTFSGRLRRAPYGVIIVFLKVVTFFSVLVMKNMSDDISQGLFTDGYKIVFGIAAILFAYSVVLTFFNTIKRLRDVKMSNWWSLIILLGPIYLFLFIYLCILPSKWPDELTGTTP